MPAREKKVKRTIGRRTNIFYTDTASQHGKRLGMEKLVPRMGELAPDEFREVNPYRVAGLSVRERGRKKYDADIVAPWWEMLFADEEERMHVRQLIFHHEKQFPLKPLNLLAVVEEMSFRSAGKPLFLQWMTRLAGRHQFYAIRRRIRSGKTCEECAAVLSNAWVNFPRNPRTRIRVWLKLFREKRAVLERLNQLDMGPERGRQATPKIKRDLLEVLDFLEREAKKYSKSNGKK